jgi:hypothetical protein
MVFKLIDAEQNYEGLYTIYADTTHCGKVMFFLDLDEVVQLANKKKKKGFWRRFIEW